MVDEQCSTIIYRICYIRFNIFKEHIAIIESGVLYDDVFHTNDHFCFKKCTVYKGNNVRLDKLYRTIYNLGVED